MAVVATRVLTVVGLLCLSHISLCLECRWFGLIEVGKCDVIKFTSANYPANYPSLHTCGMRFIPKSSDLSVRLICSDVSIYRDTGTLAFLKTFLLSYDWVFLASGPWIQTFPSDNSSLPASWTTAPGDSISFFFSTNIVDTSGGFLCTVVGIDSREMVGTCGQRNAARSARQLAHNSSQLTAHDRQRRQVFPEYNTFGGEDADLHEWPWMVLLIVLRNPVVYCGGTIISHNYVLTAASCFRDLETGPRVFLRYGTSDIRRANTTRSLNVTLHPDFDTEASGAPLNDVALVRLVSPLVFSTNVQPICLPSFSDCKHAYQGTAEITGWGKPGNQKPDFAFNLKEATAQMLPLSQCRGRTSDPVTSKQLCSYRVAGTEVCPGDAGSPLKRADNDGRYTQIGIVSYGSTSCEADDKFVVYTRVDQFLEWIRDNSDVTILP